MIKLEIQIPKNHIKHLKDKSTYNNNYYEIKDSPDWYFGYDRNNIVLQKCNEDYDYYIYIIGRFDKYGIFTPVLSFDSDFDYFEDL